MAWRSPPAPASRSLHFQGSINLRAGVFLPVSISSIRMWDLLISVIRFPHLLGHWWYLSLDFFPSLQSTLKILQSEIFQLKVEQSGKMKRRASENYPSGLKATGTPWPQRCQDNAPPAGGPKTKLVECYFLKLLSV